MGAADFSTAATGVDAKAAFNAAVEQAQYDYGHAGYTGTIAEKGGDGYYMFDVPDGWKASDWAGFVIGYAEPEFTYVEARRDYVAEPLEDQLKRMVADEHINGRFPLLDAATLRTAREQNEKVRDKWGPCGCVEISPEEYKEYFGGYHGELPKGHRAYIFFGWASS